MALELPTSATQVVQRAKTDVQRNLKGSNPFLKNSILGAFITGISHRIFDFYIQLREAIDILFPDTSEGEFLERWAAIYGQTRQGATNSTGTIFATGVAGGFIPVGTTFASSNGILYDSTASASISAQTLSVVSLTRSGAVVTATTDSDHNLGSNASVTIAGAVETEYNGTFDIKVTGATTFTYEITATPTTPATGTLTAVFTGVALPVISQEVQDTENDINVNQDNGTILTLQSPLVNVDDTLAVTFAGIGGGTNQETILELQTRLLERIQNPVAHFNSAEIISEARKVSGVTRVFVQEVTPDVGQVTIYFMRDNDVNPIPSAIEVTEVKNRILAIKPANTSDADVILAAPTAVTQNFTFTALNPNTVTMQKAITDSLTQFFIEEPRVGVNITEDAYRAAINNTIDPETGARVLSFTLGVPAADITINTGEIGLLGTIVFP